MCQPDLFLPQTGGQVYLFDPGLHKGDSGEGSLPLGHEAATKDLMGDLRTGDVILQPGGNLLLGGAGGLGRQRLLFRLRRLLRFLA